jgi:membrane-bound ClpP family serine protease
MNKIVKEVKNVQEPETGFVLGKKNYIIIAAGFALIIIGFILMSGGKSEDPNVFNPEIFSFRRITLAPIFILLGFIAEIFAIMWRPKNK